MQQNRANEGSSDLPANKRIRLSTSDQGMESQCILRTSKIIRWISPCYMKYSKRSDYLFALVSPNIM